MSATKTSKRTKLEKPVVRGPARKRSPRRSRRSDVAPKPEQRSGFLYRWFRRLGILGIIIAVLPFALILAYAPSAVHPISTLVVRDWLGGGGYVREWVPLDEFPDVLIASVLASEDGQFCSHSGVDWSAVATVAQQAMKGERTRGASTVTMQTVKNLFLPANRSVVRKAPDRVHQADERTIARAVDRIVGSRQVRGEGRSGQPVLGEQRIEAGGGQGQRAHLVRPVDGKACSGVWRDHLQRVVGQFVQHRGAVAHVDPDTRKRPAPVEEHVVGHGGIDHVDRVLAHPQHVRVQRAARAVLLLELAVEGMTVELRVAIERLPRIGRMARIARGPRGGGGRSGGRRAARGNLARRFRSV